MRVLGIDPGLTRCGIGVVEGPPGSPRMVRAEVVRTAPDEPLSERLLGIHDSVSRACEALEPDVVVVEKVLFSRNVRTAMGTAQSAGAAMLAAARHGLAVVEYTPTDVKLTVAGHGAAEKESVGRMVAAQLGLDEVPSPADVADALAVALCHLARARVGGAITTAQAQAPEDPSSWEDAIAGRPHLRIAGGTG